MARGNTRNTGHVAKGLGSCSKTRWIYRLREGKYSESIIGGPVITDNHVCLPTTKGLRVFDAQTGEIRWQGKRSMRVSPVVIGNTCWYVTETDTSIIHALDLTTYQEQWSHKISYTVDTDLTVANDMIFAGGRDGTLRGFDAQTGETRWKIKSKPRTWTNVGSDEVTENGFSCPVAVVDGRVFAPCGNGTLFVLNARTGEEVWRFEANYWMTNAAAVDDQRVYVTDSDELFVLDRTDGSVEWRSEKVGVGTVERAPAVADGMVYQMGGSAVGSLEIQALDAATGKRRWSIPVPYSSEADPCVVNGSVFVGSGDYYVFDAATGEKRWMLECDSKPVGMAFANDAAYFADYERLYAVS